MEEPQTRADSGWSVIATALLVFLLFVGLERAFAMIFVLNFATGGPGPSVFFVLLLLSGLIYPFGLHRRWPHPQAHLDMAVVIGPFLILLSLFPQPLFAVLASLGAWIVLTPLVFAAAARLRMRFAEAAVLGILIHQAGRAWLDTTPYAATAHGWLWVLIASIAFFAVWMLFARNDLSIPSDIPSARLVTPFLFLEYAFLAVPPVVAAWNGPPLLPLWITGVGGLALGLVAVRLSLGHRTAAGIVSGVLLALALFDLLILQAAPLFTYPLAQAAVVHLLALDTARVGPATMRKSGSSAALFQGLALLALFLHAVGPSWAFMPAPIGAIVRGRAAMWLFGMGIIILLVAVLVPPLTGSLERYRRRPLPLREGPYIGAVLLAIMVAMGGLVSHERPPAVSNDGPPIVFATYNIHQYLSYGKTGHYNLHEVADVIRESGAHVIGLQESEGGRITSGNLDGMRWLGHELDMHVARGPPTTEQVYGVALLSEYPVMHEQWITLPNTESVERSALRVVIDSPLGPLTVVVTHLQTSGFVKDRVAQVERLIEWTDGVDRPVLLGDFNTPAGPEDPAYRILADTFTDAWTASGQHMYAGATEFDRGLRIDHIWYGGQWEILGCGVHGDKRASDHRLVACTFMPPAWPPLD